MTKLIVAFPNFANMPKNCGLKNNSVFYTLFNFSIRAPAYLGQIRLQVPLFFT